MRERINKKSSLIISILLIVCIIATSVVAMTMTTPYEKELSNNGNSGGNNSQAMADNDRAVATKDLPLPDGQVPAGYVPWKDEADKAANWIAIANDVQMRLWLLNNHRATAYNSEGTNYVGKNAYLADSFNYSSDSGLDNSYAAWDGDGKFDAIGEGRILDGMGHTITLNATTTTEKTDDWHDGFWGFHSSFFANKNYGTLRNTNFVKTGKIQMKDQGEKNYMLFGMVVGNNTTTGVITNCSLDHQSRVMVHLNGNWNHARGGAFAGGNEGKMSYITVNFAADSYFQLNAKTARFQKSTCRVGGLVGSGNGSERNITVIGNNTGTGDNLNAAGANDGQSVGAIVGYKYGGEVLGVKVVGRVNGSGGNAGISAGATDGSVNYGACYSTESGGLGSTWVVGNGGEKWKATYTKIFTNEYDITFRKPSDFYTEYGSEDNAVITPKNLPANRIVWAVNYNGAPANNDEIFRSLTTGSFYTPNKYPGVKTELKLSFGKHYIMTEFLENAGGTSPKIYNGLPMPYNDSGANLDDRFVYTSVDGDVVHVNIKDSYASLKIKINDSETFLPTDVGTYDITSIGEWVNLGEYKYCTNPNGYVGKISIQKKNIEFNSTNVVLNNYTKTYDGFANLDTSVKTIATGILDQKIDIGAVAINYNDKNAGNTKDISVQYIFAESDYPNYSVTPLSGSITLPGVGIINTYGFDVTAGNFDLSGTNAYDKIYDKTNAYLGTIASLPLYGPTETLDLTNISAVYESPNVADCKNIVVSFALPSYATNFHLNNTSVNISGSITPKDWTVSFADFSREEFYGDGTNTNITKVYDGNNVCDIGLMYANLTPLGEYIKLKKNSVTPSTFDGVNVGQYNITFTYEMAQRAAGEMVPLENGDVLGDYRNYNLLNDYVMTTGSITAKSIVVDENSLNVENKSKTYDGNTNIIGYITSKDLPTGVVVNDVEETLALTIGNKSYANKNVVVEGGNKIIVNVTNSNPNYIIVNEINEVVTVINVTASISAAQFTPSLDAFTISGVRVYNGLTDIAAGVTVDQQNTNVNDEKVVLTITAANYNSKNVAEANSIKVTFTLSNTNYALTVNEFDYTRSECDIRITPIDITLSADNFDFNSTRQYDATSTVAISAKDIPTGILEEKLAVNVSANYNIADVTANTIIVLFNTSDTNYNITNVDGKIEVPGTITAKEITVVNGNFDVEQSKVYDASNVAKINNYNIPGAGAETISLDVGYNAVYNNVNAGTGYDITVTYTQSNPNYSLVNGSVTFVGEGSITAKAVTITANDIESYTNTKVYDQTVDYLGTFTQKEIKTAIGDETITLTFNGATYNDANVEQASAVTVSISQDNINYTINSTIDLAATITPYAVEGGATETARYTVVDSKEYDGSTLAVSEIVAGQESFIGLGADVFTFTIVANYADAKIGDDKDITIVFTSNNTNYTFKDISHVIKGAIKAVQAIINLTIDNFTFQNSREYDGTDNLYNLECNIEFNGESSIAIVSAKFDSKELGSGKTITFTIKEAHEGYYVFDNHTFTATNGEIVRKKIDLVEDDFISANTKVYDGTTAVTYEVTPKIKATGIDTESFTISIGTPSYNSKDVASANKITFTTAIADQSANDYYLIDDSFALTANITRASITVSSHNFVLHNNGSMVFYNNTAIGVDTKNKDVNIQYIQGVNSERIELLNLVANFSSVNAGTTDIVITYTYENNNYDINTTTSAVGLITPHEISDAEIQIAFTEEKIYDANDVVTVDSGKVVVALANNGTYDSDILLKSLYAKYDNVNVGENKGIKAYFLLDDVSGNFVFANKETVETVEYGYKNFANGKITVRNITVANSDIIVDTVKEYDGTIDYVGKTAAHGTIAGAYGSDVITLVFGAIAYDSKDVATASKLNVNFSLPVNSNYALTDTVVEIASTITAKTIAIDESAFTFTNGKSKVYDNSDVIDVTANTVNGMNGETISLTIDSAKYNSKDVLDANKITIIISITDTNYLINNEVVVTENVAITPYKLTADHVDFVFETTKEYDATLNLKGTIAGNINFQAIGFEDSDLSIAEFTGAYTDKNNGINKTITFNFTISNSNYAMDEGANTKDYTTGVIDKATLTVSENDFDVVKNKEYTADNSATLATHKGTVGVGEESLELNVDGTVYSGEDFNVGTNKTIDITISLKSEDGISFNYVLADNKVVVNNCAITAKEITVSKDNFILDNNGSKVYDKTNKAVVNVSGVNGIADQVLVLNATGAYDDINAGTGRVITVIYGLSDAEVNVNYTLANVEIVFDNCEITQAKLEVTFNGTRQTFRNNPNPISKLSAITLSGLIGEDTTTYIVETVEELLPNQEGVYTLKAISSNLNYVVENQGQLLLEFYKYIDGQYLIETLEDFQAIGTKTEFLAYNFKQLNNIDVNFGTLPSIKGDFSGSYDGNNKKITNAFVFNGSIFERISGTVKNLHLGNIVINAYNSQLIIGGLAGTLDAGAKVENVLFVGSIYVSTPDELVGYVGGLVGKNNGMLKNVYVIVNIEAFGNVTVGGLIGYNNGKVDGTDNIVFAEVLAVGDTAKADNVVGENEVSAEVYNVAYLENGSVTVNNGVATFKNSTLGLSINFRQIGEIYIGDTKVIDELKVYKDRYGILTTPVSSKILVTNMRDYELIGQYNYVNVEFRGNVQFFVNYEHVAFNGFRIGTIDLKGYIIDERVVGMYEYNK